MAEQDTTHDETVHRDGGARPPARAALLSWDWKGQPDLDVLSEALRALAGLLCTCTGSTPAPRTPPS